jgi:hypothetical protein
MTKDGELDRRIRKRAFEIWLEEGQPYGRHKEHWARAEKEIKGAGKPEPIGEIKFAEERLLDQGEGQPPTEKQS